MLDEVIFNLDQASDWYKKCSLTYTLGHQDPLYKHLKKNDAIELKPKSRRIRSATTPKNIPPPKVIEEEPKKG